MGDTAAKGAKIERVPANTDPGIVADIIKRDGGVILEAFLSPDQVDRINAEIEPEFQNRKFIGQEDVIRTVNGLQPHTKRLVHVVAKSDTYCHEFVANPQLLACVQAVLGEVCDSLSLMAAQAIEIFPGQQPQTLHRDQMFYKACNMFGAKSPDVLVNALLALSESTDEVGATRIIPGSHLWDDYERPVDQSMTIPAELKRGDVLLFGGRVIHGGGGNTSADRSRRVIATVFSPGYLVGEEAWPFVIPLEKVKTMPPVVQGMMGFRSYPTFTGERAVTTLWQAEMAPVEYKLGLVD